MTGMNTSQPPSSEARSERIDIRATPSAKRLLQHAAAARSKTVSEFLLDSGLAAATEALADRAHFLLDADAFQRFVERLDAPPAPSAALHRLMRTEAPWE